MRFCMLAVSCILASTSTLAQGWTGPFQLTNDTFADVNPSACPEWVAGGTTCMAWQTNRNGNWDIYAKFCEFINGNGWSEEYSVCIDSADDVNPAVAACNQLRPDSASFWCVWERRESPIVGSIWASFVKVPEDWQEPVMVGGYIHTGGDSAEPRVIVISNADVDTAWVTWTSHDTDGWHIQCTYHAGDSWYGPWYAVNSPDPIRHARLGRGRDSSYHNCPLLVWETEGDIQYAEYVDGAWQSPQEVAYSDSLDRNPDVVSYRSIFDELGPWITWESMRDGDTAVYGTAEDTFSVGRRWCDSSAAGNNRTPCGTPAAYTVDDWVHAAVVWVTDRNGNPDIYARTMAFNEDEYVDNDPVIDINPSLTTIGLTQHWCVWQSDRSGNWDLYGSYVYATGLEESRRPQAASFKLGPTIVRGTLVLHGLGTRPELPERNSVMSRAALLDISGRKVMGLRAGPNDVSRLSPGVYFLRPPGGSSVTKLVLTK